MSTPNYQGSGQPKPSTSDGLTGWLGGFLGGTAAPAYKSAPTAPPSPPPCPPCPPCAPCPESGKQKPTCPVPTQAPVTPTQTDPACEIVPAPFDLDECGDAVIPVGPGPITIVIQPRA